jgi:hypothetical protein
MRVFEFSDASLVLGDGCCSTFVASACFEGSAEFVDIIHSQLLCGHANAMSHLIASAANKHRVATITIRLYRAT